MSKTLTTKVESILHSTASSGPRRYFAGEAMVMKCKTAAVAYNPQDTRVKK